MNGLMLLMSEEKTAAVLGSLDIMWKGVLAILATGAVICAAGVIRIAKTKILDLISGR